MTQNVSIPLRLDAPYRNIAYEQLMVIAEDRISCRHENGNLTSGQSTTD